MLSDMETVYADSLVLLNAAVDYALLLCAGKLCALPLRRRRLALGALWGGLYALGAVVWPGVLGLWTVKLLAAGVSVAIAYGINSRTPRAAAAFLAVSAAFAGAVYAIGTLAGERTGQGVYLPMSARTLTVSFALCYGAVTLAFRRVGKRAERKIYGVEVFWHGRRAALRALADTGNELTDPVSGDRVLVASAVALAPLLADPAPLLLPDPVEALEQLDRQPGAPRFRLLPCAGVVPGGTALLCFRPDKVAVDGQSQRLTVAVSPGGIGDGDYQGVL